MMSLTLSILAATQPSAGISDSFEPGILSSTLNVVIDIGIIAVFFSIVLCLYRLLIGPHLVDRVIAVDTIAIQMAALVLLLSIRMGGETFFDVVLIISILGFASTVAFAQYIGSRVDAGASEELNS